VKIKVSILTISDKGARGEREDTSGKTIQDLVQKLPAEVIHYEVIPDDKDMIKEALIRCADSLHSDLILTTGGTGLSPRDLTPDATLEVIEKELPGFSEAMRAEGLKKTPHAMISRAICGTRKESLIINMPGNPKAVKDCLTAILPALPHAVSKLKGNQEDCGQGDEG
jgi:molybdenum cofactor synthesis domain-containing protein